MRKEIGEGHQGLNCFPVEGRLELDAQRLALPDHFSDFVGTVHIMPVQSTENIFLTG